MEVPLAPKTPVYMLGYVYCNSVCRPRIIGIVGKKVNKREKILGSSWCILQFFHVLCPHHVIHRDIWFDSGRDATPLPKTERVLTWRSNPSLRSNGLTCKAVALPWYFTFRLRVTIQINQLRLSSSTKILNSHTYFACKSHAFESYKSQSSVVETQLLIGNRMSCGRFRCLTLISANRTWRAGTRENTPSDIPQPGDVYLTE